MTSSIEYRRTSSHRWFTPLCCGLLASIVAVGLSPSAEAAKPAVAFIAPSPAEGATLGAGDVIFAFTVDRSIRSIARITCELTPAPTSSTSDCEALSPTTVGKKPGATSGRTYTGLPDDTFTFTVTVELAGGGALQASRSFTIDRPNHAPVAVDDTATVDEDTAFNGNLLLNDSDPDGDALTAALVAGPAHGFVSLSADGSFRYLGLVNYFGTDSFTYTVTDGEATSGTATVSVTVVGVNDPPVIGQFGVGGSSDGPICAGDQIVADLVASDPDGPFTLEIFRDGSLIAERHDGGIGLRVVHFASEGAHVYEGRITAGGEYDSRTVNVTVSGSSDPACTPV